MTYHSSGKFDVLHNNWDTQDALIPITYTNFITAFDDTLIKVNLIDTIMVVSHSLLTLFRHINWAQKEWTWRSGEWKIHHLLEPTYTYNNPQAHTL